MRHGRFSSHCLRQRPKWQPVPPPRLPYAFHSSCSNNPYKELIDDNDYKLQWIKLNAYNKVLTASATANKFLSSTTDTSYTNPRSTHPGTETSPETNSNDKQCPSVWKSTQSFFHRKRRATIHPVTSRSTRLNSIKYTASNKTHKFFPDCSHLREALPCDNDISTMVRSPMSVSPASSPKKSRSSKDVVVTLKAETAPVVIRSYSRNKLISTILDWYKSHPHPDNPKSTMIRKKLKKDLVLEVLHIQDIMRAALKINKVDKVTKSSPKKPAAVTQSQNDRTDTFKVEDVLRLIGENK